MSTRSEDQVFDLDRSLARLAAEAAPNPALAARVLADAAMVTAERQPAGEAPERKRGRGWFARLGRRPVWGMAGAAATLALSLALGFGYGFNNEREVLGVGGLDHSVLSELSPLDGLENDVISAVGEDFFGIDVPL